MCIITYAFYHFKNEFGPLTCQFFQCGPHIKLSLRPCSRYMNQYHIYAYILYVTHDHQYWLSCHRPHHPCHHLSTESAPPRNMKGTLQKYNTEVLPLADKGINDIEIYFDCPRSLHTQAVTEAISNYTPNRVLGTPPPDISPLESFLPRPVHTTLAQLRSGHCRLLKSYMARITSGVSDVCPECGVAPHAVEHLFNCSAHPTQLTVQDLCDNPAEVDLPKPG